MTNKEKYREFCKTEISIPIFSKAWWLDALCGDNWDVCLVEDDSKIVASMPYYKVYNKLGMLSLLNAPESQFLGPWISELKLGSSKKISLEKKYFDELINQLPQYSHFEQKWHYKNNNWLPFYWRGFDQTTNYTYKLYDLSDLEKVWSGFKSNIQSDIRKATNRFNLSIRTDLRVEDFLVLNSQTFERQGVKLPYSRDFIMRLDEACKNNNSRQIFIAEDEQGRHHAGAYIIWDNDCAYYLMGGADPKLRTSGAMSLCIWEAIKFSSKVSRTFDFEGSMIESIEKYFRSFGAIQVPYFAISRTPSKLISIRRFINRLQKK
ncbi:GNAT family N-acetyltransferase [Aquirufa sp. OSTEICH-129A]